MQQQPRYLSALSFYYLITISTKKLKNGNYHLKAEIRLGEKSNHYHCYLENLLKHFYDNWNYLFARYGIELIRRRNGAVYIQQPLPTALVDKLVDNGFYVHNYKSYSKKMITEYRLEGTNLYEVDTILYALFATDREAQQAVSIDDLI